MENDQKGLILKFEVLIIFFIFIFPSEKVLPIIVDHTRKYRGAGLLLSLYDKENSSCCSVYI